MDYEDLVGAFEAGTIDGTDFPHERHVRVAWGLMQRYGRDEGLRRLVAGIQGIAARAGRLGTYHDTITRAWFELIAGARDLDDHPELFDKMLLDRFYSSEQLAAGRDRWVEPDLHPLRLPAPAPAQGPRPVESLEVMRRIPAAVAVLATRLDHTVHATTVSSFSSVSRTPALINVCLANESRTLDLVRRSHVFTVSVLACDQDHLATHFATPDRPSGTSQFAGVPHHLTPFGPVIERASAWIGCRVHASHLCGDHHIVLGEVAFAEATADLRPLIRHDGAYH